MAIPKRMSLKGTISSGSFVAFLEWFGENIHETNVLSLEELSRLVHFFVSGLTFISRKVNSENWSLQICSKRTHLVWGRGGGRGLGVLSKVLPVS